MVELTRLNGNRFSLNCDTIKYIEEAPDTMLTLVTGEKLLVVESCETVVNLCVDFRAKVLRSAWPDAQMFLSRGPSRGGDEGSGRDTVASSPNA